MGSLNEQLGTNGQSITITLASLTSTSARASTVIDNTTNLFIEALFALQIKSGASSTATTGHVDVYAYATVDNGTTYTEGATGSDAGLTLVSPTNLRYVGSMNVVANATTYNGGPWSIAQCFGGALPAKWGIVIVNTTGGTLDSTEGNHLKKYQGIYGEY